ncbi:NAD(P)H-dependent oxidoreductase [Streptococcus dentasini]
MKTLIILVHPNIDQSQVNKSWKAELKKFPEKFKLHELHTLYPDWEIDVAKEQALLEQYETIIFQYPLYWYSYPPLLKKWFDDVLTHGWAYGSKGNKLTGKKFSLIISIGDKEENYSPEKSIGHTMEELTAPFQSTVKHIGGELLPIFTSYGFSFESSKELIDSSSQALIKHLLEITQL